MRPCTCKLQATPAGASGCPESNARVARVRRKGLTTGGSMAPHDPVRRRRRAARGPGCRGPVRRHRVDLLAHRGRLRARRPPPRPGATKDPARGWCRRDVVAPGCGASIGAPVATADPGLEPDARARRGSPPPLGPPVGRRRRRSRSDRRSRPRDPERRCHHDLHAGARAAAPRREPATRYPSRPRQRLLLRALAPQRSAMPFGPTRPVPAEAVQLRKLLPTIEQTHSVCDCSSPT